MSGDQNWPTLPAHRYRLVDYATKLLGLAFIVAGLEVGGASPTGLLLGGIGVAIGISTVFIDSQ